LTLSREYKWGWKNCGGCNAGYTDTGCTCFRGVSSYWKKSYGRGVGKPALDTYAKGTKFLTPYPMSLTFPTAPRPASATGAAPAVTTVQPDIPASDAPADPAAKTGGLKWQTYAGYSGDDPAWFDSKTPDAIGTTSDLMDLITATRLDDFTSQKTASSTSFSVLWTGYFRPTVTGDFTFKTNSDGGSYVWVGPTAASGYTKENAVVKNGGLKSGMQEVNGTMRLSAGAIYPIRIVYSESDGPQTGFSFAFMSPGAAINNKPQTNIKFTPPLFKGSSVLSSFNKMFANMKEIIDAASNDKPSEVTLSRWYTKGNGIFFYDEEKRYAELPIVR
jgi:hypothetical protein